MTLCSWKQLTKDLFAHCVYQAFAREGAKVIATDINESKLQELEKYTGKHLHSLILRLESIRDYKALAPYMLRENSLAVQLHGASFKSQIL